MANKSGDSSLHDWFNKSKSSDGKKGWVQLGGKFAGKPCAKQEGQKTKPKCGSSKMKRNLNKKEEEKAFRRKNDKDPNPNRKGKAKNVATEETTDQLFRKVLDEKKAEKCWDGYKKVGTKVKGGKVVNDCVKEEKKKEKKVKRKVKFWWDDDGDGKGYEKGEVKEAKGEKDACYKKVKASAKVWPSAYASGRLVQCRKKGAANYGNSKKESYSWRDDFEFVEEQKEKKKKNCGCGKDPCITYGKQDVKEAKSAAWQRKEGKRESGGLNQKGVDSYRAANPGSKLKTAVTTKPSKLKKGSKSANRRKSFCARMGGMKKRLTSAKTARDPDSRINKALRKWNCSYELTGTPIMEKDSALDFVKKQIEKKHGKGAIYDGKSKSKSPSPAEKAKASAERKKRQDADNKAYASRAKKAGYKSTQDYTNVVARYGSEDNYRKGKGLGT